MINALLNFPIGSYIIFMDNNTSESTNTSNAVSSIDITPYLTVENMFIFAFLFYILIYLHVRR